MSIELIIRGNHVTDLIAEIQQLADAVSGPTESVRFEHQESGIARKTGVDEGNDDQTVISEPEETKLTVDEITRKLTAKEKKIAAAEMITNGEVDYRYAQLTKKQQVEVDAALQPAIELPDEITIDTIRDLMAKASNDENGVPDRENMDAIRKILQDYVPKGEQVKISNISDSHYPEIASQIKDLIA